MFYKIEDCAIMSHLTRYLEKGVHTVFPQNLDTKNGIKTVRLYHNVGLYVISYVSNGKYDNIYYSLDWVNVFNSANQNYFQHIDAENARNFQNLMEQIYEESSSDISHHQQVGMDELKRRIQKPMYITQNTFHSVIEHRVIEDCYIAICDIQRTLTL